MATSSRTLSLVLLLVCVVALSTALPSGFQRQKKYNDNDLTKFRFLPDGRLLIAKRDGTFFLVNNPNATPMQSTQFMKLNNVDYTGERGVLSFVLDPNFSSNGYFYVMLTPLTAYPGFNKGMSIVRFNFNAANPASSAQALFADPDGYIGPYHYGGDILIRNNQIYMTTGDKYYAETAQDPTETASCIIRINLDGSIPADNDVPEKQNKACWAHGIRNGWRTTYDAPTGRIYIGEVGGNDQATAAEDIHIAQPSQNYGWPLCEGYCNNPRFASTCKCSDHDNAFYSYNHDGANAAIIVGYVNRGSNFPAAYQNVLFFGDYSRGWIKYLPMTSGGTITGQPVLFDDFSLGIINMEPGPDGSLWYSSVYGIDRIVFTSTDNLPPVINSATASYPNGPSAMPLLVAFSVSATDTQSLSYAWEFGDGTTSTQQNPNKIYAVAGQYNALVRVSDGTQVTVSNNILIKVGAAPVVTITSPANGFKFVANQVVQITGTATSSGVALSGSQLQWNVQLAHDDHTHPAIINSPGNSISLTIPNSGHGFTNTIYYIATLVATNAAGVSSSASINILPTTTDLTVASSPAGVTLTVDGLPHTAAPYQFNTLVGFQHLVSAPASICSNNKIHTFSSWSDGGAQTHTITVPSSALTLTATFSPTATSCGSSSSCSVFGCGTYKAANPCQCDAACAQHGDCCSDMAAICSASTPATTNTPATTKLPATTQPPASSSCAAFGCGTYKASNPCQCDSACSSYGDCCSDITATCSGPTTKLPATTQPPAASCALFGCGTYKASNPCQCDSACTSYGDCCSDKVSKCGN